MPGAALPVLVLISNDAALAAAAVAAGVDRVLLDLERRGKAARQRGRGLFLSTHSWDDLPRLRERLPAGALHVRIDPPHEDTRAQVERALAGGADGIMLPYFHAAAAVRALLDAVGGRALCVPLVETVAAVAAIGEIVALDGLQELHVGLNDLALDLGVPSLIRAEPDPVVVRIAEAARSAHIALGVGGVTDPQVQGLPVEPRRIIANLRTLGATRALLGRSFRALHEAAPDAAAIAASVARIRAAYAQDG